MSCRPLAREMQEASRLVSLSFAFRSPRCRLPLANSPTLTITLTGQLFVLFLGALSRSHNRVRELDCNDSSLGAHLELAGAPRVAHARQYATAPTSQEP